MKISIISTLLATAASLAHAETLANGAYTGTTFPDGSMLIQSISTPSEPPITLPPSFSAVSRRSPNPSSASAIQKRFTACWHTPLDHSGTDTAIQGLRNWANVPGGRTLRSGGSNTWFGFVYEEVIAYYCIDNEHSSGNIDLNDVNYAVGQMDRYCAAYTASYFQWDGTPEIVGKIRAGTTICIG